MLAAILLEAAAFAAPIIFRQPTNEVVAVGQDAMFSVGATGAPPLSFQWRKEGVTILRATNADLFISNAQLSDSAKYSVVVTEAGGASALNSQATLTVFAPLTIMSQPQSQTALAGDTVQFSIIATGSPPIRYQWALNGAMLAGATNQTLVLSNVNSSEAGAYAVRVWNFANSVDSDVATLTIVEPPAITGQPQDKSSLAG